jgi:hypothetical protein
MLQEILSIDDVRPGDIGFGPIHGNIGFLIKEALEIEDHKKAPYQHVFGVVESSRVDTDSRWTGPQAVEAMPHGAVKVDIGNRWSVEYCYVRPNYINDGQALAVAASWISQIDTPYSYLDYLALAGRHILALQPEDRTLFDKYISSTKHEICSQLIDKGLADNDWHLFEDNRPPQDVTPSAMYNELCDRVGQGVVFAYPN